MLMYFTNIQEDKGCRITQHPFSNNIGKCSLGSTVGLKIIISFDHDVVV